ncbi:hypothetical protein [Thalassospira sp.]|nr:hypothetical protein [Thalassospira sp.]
MTETETCPACEGDGLLWIWTCTLCGGSGKAPVAEDGDQDSE